MSAARMVLLAGGVACLAAGAYLVLVLASMQGALLVAVGVILLPLPMRRTNKDRK